MMSENVLVLTVCKSTPVQIQGMICLSHISEFSCLSLELLPRMGKKITGIRLSPNTRYLVYQPRLTDALIVIS